MSDPITTAAAWADLKDEHRPEGLVMLGGVARRMACTVWMLDSLWSLPEPAARAMLIVAYEEALFTLADDMKMTKPGEVWLYEWGNVVWLERLSSSWSCQMGRDQLTAAHHAYKAIAAHAAYVAEGEATL